MSSPLEPHVADGTQGGGIPAADAGNGAPPPAEGFGTGGEEPDTPERTDAGTPDAAPAETPFRTPDPRQLDPGELDPTD